MQIVNRVFAQWGRIDFVNAAQIFAALHSFCDEKKIRSAVAEFTALSVTVLMVPLFLALDLLVFRNRVTEFSLTELSQELLVLATTILLGFKARRHPESKGLLTLMCGFFACLFIRELDCFFDTVFYRGFWRWLTLATAIFAGAHPLLFQAPVKAPLCRLIGTRSHLFFSFGLIVVLLLSRTLCSGHLIWRGVLSPEAVVLFKNAMQEGLELFGYLFVFWGACLFPSASSAALGEQR